MLSPDDEDNLILRNVSNYSSSQTTPHSAMSLCEPQVLHSTMLTECPTLYYMWIKRPTRCHFWYYIYFSFIGCSTCFGPPCTHLQELTTWRYLSDVLQAPGCVGSQIRLVACLSIGKHLSS